MVPLQLKSTTCFLPRYPKPAIPLAPAIFYLPAPALFHRRWRGLD